MNIHELKKQIEELEMQVRDLKKLVEESEQEWPKNGDKYYYINESGVAEGGWTGNYFDLQRKEIGNVFRTSEEAKPRDDFLRSLRPPVPIDEVKYILFREGSVYGADIFDDSSAHLYNAFGLGFRTEKEARSEEAKARLAAILKYGGLNENA